MDMSEYVMAVAKAIAEQKDDYLRPFIKAGLNPDDYVLVEEMPLVHGYEAVGDGVAGTLVFSTQIRLRPKTDEERQLPGKRQLPGPSEIPGQTTIHDHLIDER